MKLFIVVAYLNVINDFKKVNQLLKVMNVKDVHQQVAMRI